MKGTENVLCAKKVEVLNLSFPKNVECICTSWHGSLAIL
jgi:hypothetical protein